MYTWWLRIFACDFALIGLFISHFACKKLCPQPQFAHICLLHPPFLCRARNSQQPKRAGQGRGVCRPFAKNSQQPPYPCFYLILPVSTTYKLIFESCVLVTYLTSAVAFCLPPVLMLIYPPRLARESYLSLQIIPAYNSQTAAHSLDLTNYKLSKYTVTFTSPQHRLVYHTIKQAIMHSKVAARSKA